jgi:hypothetical protein
MDAAADVVPRRSKAVSIGMPGKARPGREESDGARGVMPLVRHRDAAYTFATCHALLRKPSPVLLPGFWSFDQA